MGWNTAREGTSATTTSGIGLYGVQQEAFCLRGLRGSSWAGADTNLLTLPWFPRRPGESKWLGILVLQRTEVCVLSCIAGEPRSLPQGRRAGEGQCGETSRNAPSVKRKDTHRYTDNKQTLRTLCTVSRATARRLS